MTNTIYLSILTLNLKTLKNISQISRTALFVLFTCFIYSGTAQNSVKDLVGARASSVENEMERKQYVFIKSNKSTDGIDEFWWKSSKNKCVLVRIVNGKVAAVTNTVTADCHKSGSHSSNSHYNKNYTGDPKLGDLKGWKSAKAYNEIRNRGYYHVKDYRNNGKLVKVWYNSRYKKCKKTAEKNGYIDLVENSKQCGK